MPPTPENTELFIDLPDKREIYLRAQPGIDRKLKELVRVSVERHHKVEPTTSKGIVFEELAVAERLSNNPETKIQKEMRIIISNLLRDLNIALGEKDVLSTPDLVSVIFNKNGQLEIKEIIDIKTTVQAHERSKDQPQKTINAIEEVVEILNAFIEGKMVNDLKPREDISPDKKQRRDQILTLVRNKVRGLGIKTKITLSDDVIYSIIFQKDGGVGIPSPIDIQNHNGEKLRTSFQFSQFTRNDVDKIIDQYVETP